MTAQIIPFAPRHPKPPSLETRLRVALARMDIVGPGCPHDMTTGITASGISECDDSALQQKGKFVEAINEVATHWASARRVPAPSRQRPHIFLLPLFADPDAEIDRPKKKPTRKK